MFENEGNEIESTQSDVTEDSSSESPVDAQTVQQEAAPQKQEEPRIPYERFQEMVAKRQEAETKMQQYEQRMAELERRFQEASKPKSDKPDFKAITSRMAERLKSLDLDDDSKAYFTGMGEQLLQTQQALESIREERVKETLLSKFDELASKHSLSDADKNLYFSRMNDLYLSGQIRDAKALEAQFEAVHGPRAKQLEELKRAAIEEYTKAKKQDSSKPAAQAKGRAPQAAQKMEFSKDPAEARAQMIKRMASAMRGGGEQL